MIYFYDVMTNNNIINSAVATLVAELSTLPICTLKTNYQNTNSNSIIQTAKTLYHKNGIKAFYTASFPAIGGQIISTTSKYTIYKYLTTNNDFPIKNNFINGMISGIISSLVTHPLDVTKVHYQMSIPLMREIEKNGVRLFYRGYSKTILKIGIASTLFFPLYDYFNNQFSNPWLAATFSATTSTLIMHPFDYLKTRHMAGLKLYNGWSPATYYKGITLNLCRIVPHFVITMGCIELLSKSSSIL